MHVFIQWHHSIWWPVYYVVPKGTAEKQVEGIYKGVIEGIN